jgi:hypothetical protein
LPPSRVWVVAVTGQRHQNAEPTAAVVTMNISIFRLKLGANQGY